MNLVRLENFDKVNVIDKLFSFMNINININHFFFFFFDFSSSTETSLEVVPEMCLFKYICLSTDPLLSTLNYAFLFFS